MSKCKDGGECGLGGYCDDCYQVVIAEQDERIKQLEANLSVLREDNQKLIAFKIRAGLKLDQAFKLGMKYGIEDYPFEAEKFKNEYRELRNSFSLTTAAKE